MLVVVMTAIALFLLTVLSRWASSAPELDAIDRAADRLTDRTDVGAEVARADRDEATP